MSSPLHVIATAFFGGVLLFTVMETGWQLWQYRRRIRAALAAQEQ